MEESREEAKGERGTEREEVRKRERKEGRQREKRIGIIEQVPALPAYIIKSMTRLQHLTG